ncbi:sensor histidine kinase [Parachryseolinea silvisoli]|uniref:sensor histidine kinase n=1 Tax=Parachryseolinea silvisoli TaxID=2873601 RepID=UPI002265F7D9|nr:PAS domain S-box protein [Parachryseolinea silvisoli]MCD9014147.1 PAS domain S-box protein [Parachryseolinea silvisoli]
MESIYKIFDQAPVVIGFVRGEEYVLEFANEALLKVWKVDATVFGKSLFTVFPELERQGFRHLLDNVRRTGTPFSASEYPIQFERRDAVDTYYFDFIYQPFYEAGEITGVIAVGYDVTEKVVAKQSAQRGEKRWKELANSMPVIVWTADAQGLIDFCNELWYRTTGLTPEETHGFGWTSALHPDDLDRCVDAWHHALARHTTYAMEARYRTKEGDYKWILTRGVPVIENGNLISWYGTGTDITDQKDTEQRLDALVTGRTLKLEKTLEELQYSNANLEQFAYAASHDLREPLRKSQFYLDRLKEGMRSQLNEIQLQLFERLENAQRRMQNLIEDLLDYSQAAKGTSQKEQVDLNTVLQTVLEDLELEIETRSATIDIHALPIVLASKRQMHQLFQNLIGNSLKYSKKTVAPSISLMSTLATGGEFQGYCAASDYEKVFHHIKVTDNGIGFDQKDADRIFMVFTRLHSSEQYRGSGIGLSIVRKVVESHDGYIWSESELGQGAVFHILLPSMAQDGVPRLKILPGI